MSEQELDEKTYRDRVDALNDVKPSPLNARNAAIVIGALVLGGGYFGVKASGAQEDVKAPLDIAAAASEPAPQPRSQTLFAPVAYRPEPVDTGPSELELQMATLMGAVQTLGARIEEVVASEQGGEPDAATEAVLQELRTLAAENEAMREQLAARLEEAEAEAREDERRRAALEMEIAELRAQMLSGQAFGPPTPFAGDAEPSAAEVAALAEAEHRRELERLRLEAELSRAERLEEERLAREREAIAHEREKELRSLEAHYEGREAAFEAARTEREAAIARMDALEAERLAAIDVRLAAERERRNSGGVALDDGAPPVAATVTALGAAARDGRASVASAYRATANEGFLATAAEAGVETVYAVNLPNPDRLIPQGSLIPGVMETAVQSDLPGGIRAVVSDPVWSADGANILIPAGSRLIGQYRSDVSIGQTRVLIAWTRAITPDHRSIMLGSSGADALGRAGQTGAVDTHFAQKFEAAFLVSIVTGIANFGTTVPVSREYVDQGLDTGVGATADAANSVLEEYLSIPPTIHVDQGSPITVFVQRDLYL